MCHQPEVQDIESMLPVSYPPLAVDGRCVVGVGVCPLGESEGGVLGPAAERERGKNGHSKHIRQRQVGVRRGGPNKMEMQDTHGLFFRVVFMCSQMPSYSLHCRQVPVLTFRPASIHADQSYR